jgi:hypothetical protein
VAVRHCQPQGATGGGKKRRQRTHAAAPSPPCGADTRRPPVSATSRTRASRTAVRHPSRRTAHRARRGRGEGAGWRGAHAPGGEARLQQQVAVAAGGRACQVIGSPWSQLTSECQRCGHPRRLNDWQQVAVAAGAGVQACGAARHLSLLRRRRQHNRTSARACPPHERTCSARRRRGCLGPGQPRPPAMPGQQLGRWLSAAPR